jgi:hypothetical protein
MVNKPTTKQLRNKHEKPEQLDPEQLDEYDDDNELIYDDEEIDDNGYSPVSKDPLKELKGRGTRVKGPPTKHPLEGFNFHDGYDGKPFKVKAASSFEIDRFNKLYRDKGDTIIALIISKMIAELFTVDQFNLHLPQIAKAIFGDDNAVEKLRSMADNMSK